MSVSCELFLGTLKMGKRDKTEQRLACIIMMNTRFQGFDLFLMIKSEIFIAVISVIDV